MWGMFALDMGTGDYSILITTNQNIDTENRLVRTITAVSAAISHTYERKYFYRISNLGIRMK